VFRWAGRDPQSNQRVASSVVDTVCLTRGVTTMARIEFGRLSAAWKGEASDFTPLLAEQLDALGEQINVDLISIGESEVLTTGGRRIDIVAQSGEGLELVVENQYGRADHDHLTRGLAYAVARHARGLIVVAEQHRDEFRALAEYLNDLAEVDPERGIKVWLVETKAVRIASGPWAPLFNAVVQPNSFTASVEVIKKAESHGTLEDFWLRFDSDSCRAAAEQVVGRWQSTGYPYRIGPATSHVVLMAPGPSGNGRRTVVAIYPDGRVMVPFASYAGSNSGIPIEALTSEAFRASANVLFGFSGTEKQARTTPGWLRPEVEDDLFAFIQSVASAYDEAGSGDPLQ